MSEISRRTGTSTVAVGSRFLAHDGLVRGGDEYSAPTATLLYAAITHEYGKGRHRVEALRSLGLLFWVGYLPRRRKAGKEGGP